MKPPAQIAHETAVMSLLRDCVVVDENHNLDVTVDFFSRLTAIQQATEEGAKERHRMCARVEHGEFSEDCPFCLARRQTPGVPNPMCHLCELESCDETQRAQLRDLTDQLHAHDGVIARLREALVAASALITHGDFKNGNTHPDGHGPDEGEVMAGRMYDSIRNALDSTPATYADRLKEAEASANDSREYGARMQRERDDARTELASLRTQADMDNIRFKEMQDAGTRLEVELAGLRGLLEEACELAGKSDDRFEAAGGYEKLCAIRAHLLTDREPCQDTVRLDWLQDGHNTISWNDRAGGFVVQKCQQVCGNIGVGRTLRAAIDAAASANDPKQRT